METITNAANAVSRAILGDSSTSQDKTQQESGTEPVSGVTGAGTAEKPYDAGNTEENPSLGGTAASSTQPDLGQRRDKNTGDLDTQNQGESTLRTSHAQTHSSTVPGAFGSEDEPTATTSGGFETEGEHTGAAGYSTYMANKLDARDDSQQDQTTTSLGDKSSTLPSGLTGVGSFPETESSNIDARADSQRDESTMLGNQSYTRPSDTTHSENLPQTESSSFGARDDSQRDVSTTLGDKYPPPPSHNTTNVGASSDDRSYGQSDLSTGEYGSTSIADKPDTLGNLPGDVSKTLGDKYPPPASATTNVGASSDDRSYGQPSLSSGTYGSTSTGDKPDTLGNLSRDEPTSQGDEYPPPPSATTDVAATSDDRGYGQPGLSSGTYGSTSIGDKPDIPSYLPREEPTGQGDKYPPPPPSATTNVAATSDDRGYGQPGLSSGTYGSVSIGDKPDTPSHLPRDEPTGQGDKYPPPPSATTNVAVSSDDKSYGQSGLSSGTYGSTTIADKSDTPSYLPRDEPTGLGANTSTLPSGRTNLTNPSDTQRESTTGFDDTTTQSSTLQGSDDRYESSTIGGDSSDRLQGQSDTKYGPSGGIAEGGIPQGRNIAGDVRPEHETDKTGVTGIHSNDPKMTQEFPSFSNEPSVAPGGQSRAPVGGIGVAEPSVGADPSSGQKPFQKEQGADRPTEEPSGEHEQAIRGEKEATEKTAERKDISGRRMGSDPNEERGTGEKWVKSTGMAADGGDFDAAKPGAGREADRLLEQQGIHRTGAPPKVDENDPTEKHGLAEKLKDKLHIGHKH
ncbi:MAG: hypothetical protein M1816_004746 [Peltula sp. TS41687]|nr:MAG: hypothetical protein M1816_004746 [Peltula sp. TS41687]